MTEKTFIITLIKTVEKHRCVWDTSSPSFAKRENAEIAWREISEECGKPVGFCKDKWKNVRIGFLRSLRGYPENRKVKSSSSKRKPFYLYKFMEFILPHIQHTALSSASKNLSNCAVKISASEVVKVEVDNSSNSEILDYDELDHIDNMEVLQNGGHFSQFGLCTPTRSENSQNRVETDQPPNKKCNIPGPVNDEQVQIQETKEELALMSFFKGIASDVLSLSIQNQRFFKRKIVELIDDLHTENEKMQAIPKRPCIYYSNSSNNDS